MKLARLRNCPGRAKQASLWIESLSFLLLLLVMMSLTLKFFIESQFLVKQSQRLSEELLEIHSSEKTTALFCQFRSPLPSRENEIRWSSKAWNFAVNTRKSQRLSAPDEDCVGLGLPPKENH